MIERFIIPLLFSMTAVSALCSSFYLVVPPLWDEIPSPPWMTASESDPTATWRHTSEGWQDSTNWRIKGEETHVKSIAQIHPVLWSIFVLLLVIGAVVFVSDEWNLKRLWIRS